MQPVSFLQAGSSWAASHVRTIVRYTREFKPGSKRYKVKGDATDAESYVGRSKLRGTTSLLRFENHVKGCGQGAVMRYLQVQASETLCVALETVAPEASAHEMETESKEAHPAGAAGHFPWAT